MLKDLKVLNGNLELEFNEYIYLYTVTVDQNTNKLELEYELDEDSFLVVRNNDLLSNETVVYLDVYNNDNEATYTLYVYKDNTNLSSGIDNYKKSLEVVNNDVDLYKIELLGVGIFLIIVLVFSILFRRSKIGR